ncbi:MAG: hypothetical protein WCW01_04445 [Gammaproteobacteria bacterium]
MFITSATKQEIQGIVKLDDNKLPQSLGRLAGAGLGIPVVGKLHTFVYRMFCDIKKIQEDQTFSVNSANQEASSGMVWNPITHNYSIPPTGQRAGSWLYDHSGKCRIFFNFYDPSGNDDHGFSLPEIPPTLLELDKCNRFKVGILSSHIIVSGKAYRHFTSCVLEFNKKEKGWEVKISYLESNIPDLPIGKERPYRYDLPRYPNEYLTNHPSFAKANIKITSENFVGCPAQPEGYDVCGVCAVLNMYMYAYTGKAPRYDISKNPQIARIYLLLPNSNDPDFRRQILEQLKKFLASQLGITPPQTTPAEVPPSSSGSSSSSTPASTPQANEADSLLPKLSTSSSAFYSQSGGKTKPDPKIEVEQNMKKNCCCTIL